MAVYGYPRASTKKQVDSPETQMENVRRYAALQGLGEVTFYVDAAKTGKVPWQNREAGRELFARLKPGDEVIIAKLDRAFRKLSDCVVVLEQFQAQGIKLHVVNLLGGAIDLSSPMGRFLIHILAAFAELERAFISERTRDGLANKKRLGAAYTNFPGYGMRWERRLVHGKWQKFKVPDQQEREVMGSILRWRAEEPAWAWKEISDHLTYKLKLKTKDGKTWDINRVRRAWKAELLLQLEEQRENR
jgi:DNA invertase Pin-like site-specific DNA recombinase